MLFDLENDKFCVYRGETYSVKDNGMVFRHTKSGGRRRIYDNQWTYGKPNIHGHMEIALVPVHRIIATAYHGEPPTNEHVVDHIDTNRQNNRPENLRWVTRLENILLNPITCRKLAIICGSVEAFLAEPSKFRGKFPDPNYDWMCSVSKEEAEFSKQRLLAWAESDKYPSGGIIEDWVFGRGYQNEVVEEPEELTKSLTPNALQRKWKTPSEFPLCPQEFVGNPLVAYNSHLEEGALFCVNELYKFNVYKSTISDDGRSLYVMTYQEEGMKPWGIAEVTHEDGMFIHRTYGTYFEQNGAEKYFCLVMGLEWTGGDGIDDYC